MIVVVQSSFKKYGTDIKCGWSKVVAQKEREIGTGPNHNRSPEFRGTYIGSENGCVGYSADLGELKLGQVWETGRRACLPAGGGRDGAEMRGKAGHLTAAVVSSM